MTRKKLRETVDLYAEASSEKMYKDAAAAKALGIELGTRYSWGRDLGVTFPPMRPFQEGSTYSRVPGELPPSLRDYLSDDWFTLKTTPTAKFSSELALARPEADFYCVIRIVKQQKTFKEDVLQRIVPFSALGNKTRNAYHSLKIKTPFEVTGDRVSLDYDDMDEEEDIWADDRSEEEPDQEAWETYQEKFIPWARAKWEAHRAAFRSANDDITFRVIVHIINRTTQQYAGVLDHDLTMEDEDPTNGSFQDQQMNAPTPTFGYDTVALRTEKQIDILGCCDTFDFQPQFALGFKVLDSLVLGNGDIVRTTFQAFKFRLSFGVRSKNSVRSYWSRGSHSIFHDTEHSHNHTLILLRNYKELWRPS